MIILKPKLEVGGPHHLVKPYVSGINGATGAEGATASSDLVSYAFRYLRVFDF